MVYYTYTINKHDSGGDQARRALLHAPQGRRSEPTLVLLTYPVCTTAIHRRSCRDDMQRIAKTALAKQTSVLREASLSYFYFFVLIFFVTV